MGRPSLLTPELQAEAVKLARAGVPKQIIADKLKVGRSTFLRWLQWGGDDYQPAPSDEPPKDLTPYRDFREAFAEARADAITLCEATWLKAVREGDAAQAAHWLKVHHPDLYKEQADVNLTFGNRQAAMDAWKQSILDMDVRPPDDEDSTTEDA